MRVSIFQFETRWMDVSANLDLIAEKCKALEDKTDWLVLPEMFNTGYTMKPSDISIDDQNITLSVLQALSASYKMTISGSIPMYRDDQWFNTFVIVNENGLVYTYDKVHLFTPAGEKAVYSSGHQANIYNTDSCKILPLVCYDLRFPYLSFGEDQPDLIIYSANWPETRIHHWKALLRARAIENQCFVVGVNRTGKDENGFVYSGASIIIDFNGDIITEMGTQPSLETHTLDMTAMAAFRQKLPFFNDRRFDL